MKNRWFKDKENEYIEKYAQKYGEDLALRIYTSRLIGEEKELVLHGGGNTSVKTAFRNILGKKIPAIFVKASGLNLQDIKPEGHIGLDLEYFLFLRTLSDISDESMVNEILTHRYDAFAATPSIETLMHTFISPKYIDHTHANSVLALTNQVDGQKLVSKVLGNTVIILNYKKPGFRLAKEVADAYESSPASEGMVLMKHGLITWGETARESYERTIKLATRAEEYIAREGKKSLKVDISTSPAATKELYLKVAPILKGLLAIRTKNADSPYKRFIIKPLLTEEMIRFVDSEQGKEIALTPPLTTDHLIRTKSFPMWIDAPKYDNEKKLRKQISDAIRKYAKKYDAYFERYSRESKTELNRFDSMPRVILMPGLGAICTGRNVAEADVVRDITAQTLSTKTKIASMGKYEGLNEGQLFDMEYFSLQLAKLGGDPELPLERSVAIVTGAAGAIGTGICQQLLENGCHVAVTDLAGDNLNSLVSELEQVYGGRVIGVPLDVTLRDSVKGGFEQVIETWGGIDLVVLNAGVAYVSSLADMDIDAFRKLEQVNVEGTLNVLSEAARIFKVQGTGGDIVLISTKNVFAPGAKFGAYSATKAAAHQLARIASLELAEMDVRVNMVSPDAVFSHGKRKSGLWAEVGPDRMRARGLDELGLEEYYRNRNLLKAKVTATHVGKAVLYFATRQTPTTGATIPVDGGLPDSTPR